MQDMCIGFFIFWLTRQANTEIQKTEIGLEIVVVNCYIHCYFVTSIHVCIPCIEEV